MNNPPDLSRLCASDFLPFVDSIFTVQLNGNQTTLRLVECTMRPQFAGEGFREPFNMLFASEDQATLPQATYSFEFPQLGSINLFMVPVAAGKHLVTFN